MGDNIIWGAIGYILGAFGTKGAGNFSNDLTIKDSGYIPPYSGHLLNRGTWDNEDWYYYEPKYRTRYVNMVPKDDYYILSIDWEIKQGAKASKECPDQLDAETEVKCAKMWYKQKVEIVCQNTEPKYYIYTIEKGDEIILIVTDKEDKDFNDKKRMNSDSNGYSIIDFIKCLDYEELRELLIKMKEYYYKYLYTKIEYRTEIPREKSWFEVL